MTFHTFKRQLNVLATVASRRNIHHRPALLWRFVILAPNTNCILTYLLRGRAERIVDYKLSLSLQIDAYSCRYF